MLVFCPCHTFLDIFVPSCVLGVCMKEGDKIKTLLVLLMTPRLGWNVLAAQSSYLPGTPDTFPINMPVKTWLADASQDFNCLRLNTACELSAVHSPALMSCLSHFWIKKLVFMVVNLFFCLFFSHRHIPSENAFFNWLNDNWVQRSNCTLRSSQNALFFFVGEIIASAV